MAGFCNVSQMVDKIGYGIIGMPLRVGETYQIRQSVIPEKTVYRDTLQTIDTMHALVASAVPV